MRIDHNKNTHKMDGEWSMGRQAGGVVRDVPGEIGIRWGHGKGKWDRGKDLASRCIQMSHMNGVENISSPPTGHKAGGGRKGKKRRFLAGRQAGVRLSPICPVEGENCMEEGRRGGKLKNNESCIKGIMKSHGRRWGRWGGGR